MLKNLKLVVMTFLLSIFIIYTPSTDVNATKVPKIANDQHVDALPGKVLLVGE